MTKQDLAAYLVSLAALLESQDRAGGNSRSQVLAAEYEKHWGMLKEKIEGGKDET